MNTDACIIVLPHLARPFKPKTYFNACCKFLHFKAYNRFTSSDIVVKKVNNTSEALSGNQSFRWVMKKIEILKENLILYKNCIMYLNIGRTRE